MKNTIMALAILAVSQLALTQTGKVYDNLSLDSEILKMERYKKRYGAENISDEEWMDWYKQHSAVELVNNMSDSQKKEVRWFIDCGDDDFLFEGNSLVHIAMRKREIPHEFRIRDGGHSWTYWRESLPVVLSFVSDAFHQN